jgi:hypothetical protein
MQRLLAVLLPLVLVAACSAPPQKEIDLAQGALDAARAAGAEQYAPEEFSAAAAALQQAHEAVAQGDYRLALTQAIDAHARAQDAAKGAADGKARARGDAEAAIGAATASITQLKNRLAAPDIERLTAKDTAGARQAAGEAEAAVQKAREAIKTEDYLRAREVVKDIPARITAEILAIDALAAKRAARTPRRTR